MDSSLGVVDQHAFIPDCSLSVMSFPVFGFSSFFFFGHVCFMLYHKMDFLISLLKVFVPLQLINE